MAGKERISVNIRNRNRIQRYARIWILITILSYCSRIGNTFHNNNISDCVINNNKRKINEEFVYQRNSNYLVSLQKAKGDDNHEDTSNSTSSTNTMHTAIINGANKISRTKSVSSSRRNGNKPRRLVRMKRSSTSTSSSSSSSSSTSNSKQQNSMHQSPPSSYQLSPRASLSKKQRLANDLRRSETIDNSITMEELELLTNTILSKECGTLQGADLLEIEYLMKQWVRVAAVRKNKESAMIVEKLLQHVVRDRQTGNEAAVPDSNLYRHVISAWCKSGEVWGVMRAEQIMMYMEEHFQQGNLDVEIDTWMVNVVLNAWASTGDLGAAKRAEQIVTWMKSLCEKYPTREIRPDISSYTALLHAWSKNPARIAPERATDILNYLEKISGVASNNGNDEGNPYKSRYLQSLKPSVISYTAVINTWVNSNRRDAANNALEILYKMNDRYNRGDSSVKPNSVTYTSVINAFAKDSQRTNDSAYKAEQLLKVMKERYEAGDVDVKPCCRSYNAVIYAWSRSGDPKAASKAEKILHYMEKCAADGDDEMKPDLFSYNVMINALSKSREYDASSRAEKLVNFMEEQYDKGYHNFRPNIYTYTALIDSFAKVAKGQSPEKAERILNHMYDLHKKGVPEVKPNYLTINAVMDCFAKSTLPDKAKKVIELLEKMKSESKTDKSVTPNSFTYTTVLNACAFTFGSADKMREAFELACLTFKELKTTRFKPSHVTYGTFIKAIDNLVDKGDPNKDFLIKATFKECCEVGQVSGFVLKNLELAVSPKEYLNILKGDRKGVVDVFNLPSEWRANVENDRYTDKQKARKKEGASRKKGGRSR